MVPCASYCVFPITVRSGFTMVAKPFGSTFSFVQGDGSRVLCDVGIQRGFTRQTLSVMGCSEQHWGLVAIDLHLDSGWERSKHVIVRTLLPAQVMTAISSQQNTHLNYTDPQEKYSIYCLFNRLFFNAEDCKQDGKNTWPVSLEAEQMSKFIQPTFWVMVQFACRFNSWNYRTQYLLFKYRFQYSYTL